MKGLFITTQEWMRRFLGLQEPTLPNRLDLDRVTATLDVAQQGWADFARPGQVSLAGFNVAANSVAGEVSLTGVMGRGTAQLIQVCINHTGGAAALNIEFVLRHRNLTEMTLWRDAVAVGDTLGWSHVGLGQHYWYVPEDHEVVMIHPATGAAETLRAERLRLTSVMGARLL